MRIKLPDHVRWIIEKLENAGYEAFAVGGCVRDSLLGRNPSDWDITTSAKPMEMKAVFYRTVDTGLQHGTVTVLVDKTGYEVTTYRVDGEYEDARHPKEVTFTGSLEEDLKRRDFTINAMAYNEKTGLVDLYGGMKDIQLRIIRCVGNPTERFTEDALRIMRAIRFSAQLGYEIEPDTKAAITDLAQNLRYISEERIQAELQKLILSPNPQFLRTAYETGITREFLPEFDRCMETMQNTPHHCYTVGEHILKGMQLVEPDKILRFTMLLHDIAKPLAKTTDENGRDHFQGHAAMGEELARSIMRRLKMDNETIRKVSLLIRYHDERPEGNQKSVRRAVNKIGEELFPYYLQVQQADMLAQSTYKREAKQDRLNRVITAYQEIMDSRQCVSLKTLAVTGKDLIDYGMKPGKEIGAALQHLLDVVLENPALNRKEELLAMLPDMQIS
ncbi:MAG: CCA tRNA nucleotidyltransferase [Blautia sp.]|nr:CCA tRNA nucleotidyltransferase [Blautia sp.]